MLMKMMIIIIKWASSQLCVEFYTMNKVADDLLWIWWYQGSQRTPGWIQKEDLRGCQVAPQKTQTASFQLARYSASPSDYHSLAMLYAQRHLNVCRVVVLHLRVWSGRKDGTDAFNVLSLHENGPTLVEEWRCLHSDGFPLQTPTMQKAIVFL